MFWGLILEPNKKYTQVVDQPFRVTMACLDVKNPDDKNMNVQVVFCCENRKYIICNLNKQHLQAQLDLSFELGSQITFICNGNAGVHLTGYHLFNCSTSDEEDEDCDEDYDPKEVAAKMKLMSKKRKSTTSPAKNDEKKRKKDIAGKNDGDQLETDPNDLVLKDKKFFNVSVSDEESDESDENETDDDLEGTYDEEDEIEEEEEVDEDMEDESEELEEEYEEEQIIEPKKVEKPVQQKDQHKEKNKRKKNKEKTEKVDQSEKVDKNEKQMNGNVSSSKKEKQAVKEKSKPQKRVVAGVQIEDVAVGTGPVAKKGQLAYVYYVGKLKNGKIFDKTMSGAGFKFRIGGNEVIKGWDLGVLGMKVGGTRKLIIPPSAAYGHEGIPPTIPGNSTLYFDIELKNVR